MEFGVFLDWVVRLVNSVIFAYAIVGVVIIVIIVGSFAAHKVDELKMSQPFANTIILLIMPNITIFALREITANMVASAEAVAMINSSSQLILQAIPFVILLNWVLWAWGIYKGGGGVA